MQAHVKKFRISLHFKFRFDEDVWPIEDWYVTTDLLAE